MKRLSNVDQNNRLLTNVPTPSSGGDAANKTYVDTKKTDTVSTNNRLLGRTTAGAGVIEEITIGSGLTVTGTTLSSPAILRVLHGATASTARPTGAIHVEWLGSVVPTNATTVDTWIDTA